MVQLYVLSYHIVCKEQFNLTSWFVVSISSQGVYAYTTTHAVLFKGGPASRCSYACGTDQRLEGLPLLPLLPSFLLAVERAGELNQQAESTANSK